MNDIAKLKKERLALVAQIRSLMEPFYGISKGGYEKERCILSPQIRAAYNSSHRAIDCFYIHLSPQIRAAYKALDDFDLKQEKVREAMKKDNDREAQHSCR